MVTHKKRRLKWISAHCISGMMEQTVVRWAVAGLLLRVKHVACQGGSPLRTVSVPRVLPSEAAKKQTTEPAIVALLCRECTGAA